MVRVTPRKQRATAFRPDAGSALLLHSQKKARRTESPRFYVRPRNSCPFTVCVCAVVPPPGYCVWKNDGEGRIHRVQGNIRDLIRLEVPGEEIVNVYCTLPLARADVGVKVTVFASDERVNVPGTTALLPVTVSMNELVFSDTGFIGLLNCRTIGEFVATMVAPFAGVMLTTVGFGNIAAVPVVKVSVTAEVMVFPARSATPLIVMV